MRIILVGPPGVGKGTQSSLLEERLGLTCISSGATFRANIESGTELGKIAEEYMERGDLVPDDVTIGMITGRLNQDDVRAKGFILDGFPRTVVQAEKLDGFFHRSGIELDGVVSLTIDDETVVSRLSARRTCPNCGQIFHLVHRPPRVEGVCDNCGHDLMTRHDDHPETIRRRLKVFHEQTAPVIAYYAKDGRVHQVDGDRDTEVVYQDIIKQLGQC